MRYSPTERKGMLKAALVVTEDLNWIFRDQPLVDVGIDALIEKCDSGNPSGKFVAAQVKSGSSNFGVSKERLTYYVSNVHRHYWTCLNVPIILIGYIPEDEKCYWREISTKTLQRTENQWKLVIPKENVLNKTSKRRLEKILVSFDDGETYSQIFNFDYDSEFSEEYEAFADSIHCVKNINSSIASLGSFFKKSADSNAKLISQGYDQTTPQFKGSVKQQSRRILSDAQRLMTEIRLFSRSFPEEFYVVEKLIYSEIARGNLVPEQLKTQIRVMPDRIAKAVSGIKTMREAARIESKIFPVMNEAVRKVGECLDLLISEFADAKELVARIQTLPGD